MKRQAMALLTMTWLMLGVALIPGAHAWAASERAVLKSVTSSASPTGTELVLRVYGIYSYKTIQAGPDTLFIDLTGVRVGGLAPSRKWVNPIFMGYKLMPYQDASGQPVVRVQVGTKQTEAFVVQKDDSELHLIFGKEQNVDQAASPSPVAAPSTSPATVAPPAAPAGPLLVSNVTFEKQDSGETLVEVVTTRCASYRARLLPNPARLVVDIEGAKVASPRNSYPVDTMVLKDIRIGQYRSTDPSIARVVADLKGDPAFDVHATPAGIRIDLRPRGEVVSTPPANSTPVLPSKPAEPKSVEIASTKPPDAKVPSAVVPAAKNEKPDQQVIAAPPANVTSALPLKPAESKSADTASAKPPGATLPNVGASSAKREKTDQQAGAAPPATVTPVFPPEPAKPKSVETASAKPPGATFPNVDAPLARSEKTDQQSTAALPIPAGTGDAIKPDAQSTLPNIASSKQVATAPIPPPASATPEALRAEQAAQVLTSGKSELPADGQATPPATPLPSPAETKPEYTGEPISLNLKDVDLKDFFRLIHEISGLNIIIDPNVNGSVTMVLDSVPWDQALDIVLKNNDLGKTLEGNVLRIARLQTLTAEQEGQTKLAAARMDAAPLVTIFRPINYAKATDIATLLKTWAGGGALSRRGTVLVDTRANTLIISDVQSQIPIVQNILTKLDRKAKQVSIEARVVLATADFTRTLASSLLGGYGNRSTTTAAGTGSGTTQTIPAPTTGAPVPIITSTPATAGGFGTAAITNYSARYFINAALSAAEERDQAKTISRPTIVTQNNIQGMVQQGVQVPIQTTINNTVSVQYYAATLQLTVTPQVTDDNNIFLIIHVLNDSVGASISGVGPEINTQEATTQVLVPDGGTVVFGGITVTSRSKSATYVPLLGSIPVLGHLFKNSNVSDEDQELLFFVSPKVLTL